MGEVEVNCAELLERFLLETGINIRLMKTVEKRINDFNKVNEDKSDIEYSSSIIASVIIDSFKLNSGNLKHITDYCIKKGIQI